MNHEKSQITRLADVFIIGPFILWYAVHYKYTNKNKKVEPSLYNLMVFIGLSTMVYDGYNFISHYMNLPALPL